MAILELAHGGTGANISDYEMGVGRSMWTCSYCGGLRDAKRESCPGCGAARRGHVTPKREPVQPQERDVMSYILDIANLGPEWAKLILGSNPVQQAPQSAPKYTLLGSILQEWADDNLRRYI